MRGKGGAAHPSACSFPVLSRAGEEIKMEKLVGRDRGDH